MLGVSTMNVSLLKFIPLLRYGDNAWTELMTQVRQGRIENVALLEAMEALLTEMRSHFKSKLEDILPISEPIERKPGGHDSDAQDIPPDGSENDTEYLKQGHPELDAHTQDTSELKNAKKTTPPLLPPKKRKGHGKHGFTDFKGAEFISVPPNFPENGDQKAYGYPSAYKVVVTGSIQFKAKIYVLPRQRRDDGELQTTRLPESVGPLYGRFDAEAAASLVLSHYKLGATLYGTQALFKAFGLPLVASNLWDAIEQSADVVRYVHKAMKEEVANATVLHIDSTTKKVMTLKKDIEKQQEEAAASGKDPSQIRHGIRTTSLLGWKPEGYRISLFVTGQEHAGEILDKTLEARTVAEKVLVACDASSQNTDTKFRASMEICLCNAHAFRKFKECEKNYPDLAPKALALYRVVFENERHCKESGLSGAERLTYHQKHSQEAMQRLRDFLESVLGQQQVLPKSEFGKAANYFVKHFQDLTAFLRLENAPLHNNDNEIEIKVSVKHRKNSLFYATELGAKIGDIWMSLIQTAILNGKNPLEWIVKMLRNPDDVRSNPRQWLPWAQQELEATT